MGTAGVLRGATGMNPLHTIAPESAHGRQSPYAAAGAIAVAVRKVRRTYMRL